MYQKKLRYRESVLVADLAIEILVIQRLVQERDSDVSADRDCST